MGCQNTTPLSRPTSQTISQPLVDEKPRTPFTRSKTNRQIKSEMGSIMNHFKVLKAIGTNRLGTTLYAQDIHTGTFRAIREVNKSLLRDDAETYNEIEILKDFDHPNIIKTYQTIETNINYYAVFEYLNGGNLKSKIKRNGNEVALSKYIHEVISALNYMHIQKVVHCNLNPNNILFSISDDECIAKVVGFNYSQRLDDLHPVDIKNLAYFYVSPEMLKKNFNEKTDLWSIGVIVYELLVGKPPYLSKDKHDIVKEIYRGEVDFANPNFTTLSFNAQDFIRKLLNPNSEERMSAKEALIHPWLSLSAKEYILNYEAMMKLRNFKIKSNVTREFLKLINTNIDFKDHEIISVFKNLDGDCDGFITKDEVVETFRLVGIDATNEINVIMANVDIDGSGELDFTEIKIALTDWECEINEELLKKVLRIDEDSVSATDLRHIFEEILPHEWNDFLRKTKMADGKIHVQNLKDYLLSNLE